jgi:phenylalanyl-tRNA synthetase beta chain
VVEGLLTGLHISDAQFERGTHPALHPGRSADLRVKGIALGSFGQLHPLVAAAYKLDHANVFVAELDLAALLVAAQANHRIEALPTTPPVLQDIAVVVAERISAAQAEAVIRANGGDLLRGVRLFDVYQGDAVPAQHKSLAYSLTYQAEGKTLTDKEVASVQTRILKALERELGAQQRA